ncbi:PREDICTED: receptor-like protein 12 [Tarenaya hassleriana]|uniref:receptor-like protein 12 n=1 Tax=Tarenaya hassleriana TaxID=28532 RepID=UPI0008FD71EE|nr:PREDICTED: receptor-like protein 12 [Tarenaya hassleriana]
MDALSTESNLQTFPRSATQGKISGGSNPRRGADGKLCLGFRNLSDFDLFQFQLRNPGDGRNRLSGSFPLGILNLTKLSHIHLRDNELTGSFPPNMTSLSDLEEFDASGNRFVGAFPSSLLEIPSLTYIDLSGNQLRNFADYGNIPPTSRLENLYMGDNNFSGPIPMASISKLVNLQVLVLSRWNTGGDALDVSPLYHLKSLYYLHLSDLKMTTAIDLSLLSPLQSLSNLDLSGNRVSTANITSASDFSQQLEALYMSGCNVTEFPLFLRTQRHLQVLDLSGNMIKGQVLDWLWRLPRLYHVNMSHNSLGSFQASSSQQMFPQSQLQRIDVSWNDFQGPLFIPPSHSIQYLGGSNNNFSGGIPQSVCSQTYLQFLDLSHNNFDGSVPRCLGNTIGSLIVLSLRHNRLSGTLPDIFVDANELRSIDLSGNRLEGKLPKSLINCSSLEVLNVASNRIKDTFPFWLNSLKELQTILLVGTQSLRRGQVMFRWGPCLFQ